MRTLETNFESAINAYTQHLCWMIDFEFASMVRYTSAQNPIYDVSGNMYHPRTIEITPSYFDLNIATDKASIRIDNVDLSIGALLEGGEKRGKKVHIWQAALNEQGKLIIEDGLEARERVFLGFLTDAEYDRQTATIGVASIMVMWKKKIPRRLTSPSCQVISFGDSKCQFATPESSWCDRSWARCVALDNEENFRGFRYMPYLMSNPDIWWGKVPK